MITTSETVAVPTVGRIPVRNIWLLMLYASELYRESCRARSVDVEGNLDELPNLVAEVLTRAVERRMQRNLSYGYRHKQADLNRVRGRIDLLITERRQLLQRGRVACSFEELTVDTPRNRFVKAALNLLNRIVSKDDLVHRCRNVSASMERAGVTGDLTSNDRRRPRMPLSRLGRLGVNDREMLAAARLAFDLALPTEDIGASHLATPDKDEVWARKLFEKAVGGFYDVVLNPQGWSVSTGSGLKWPVDDESAGISSILPSMQTDIVLERPSSHSRRTHRQRTVIDTKFTSILKPGQYGKARLSSEYIYQMYAYLRSQECGADPASLDSTGVLLHPAVDDRVDEYAVIQGHKIRFVTVDLAEDSRTIRYDLLRAIDADIEPSFV